MGDENRQEVRSAMTSTAPGMWGQEEALFAPLLQLTGPQKGQLAQHRQRMGPARRERPSPAHPFHVAVYIRYFNQTRYENYLELHKRPLLIPWPAAPTGTLWGSISMRVPPRPAWKAPKPGRGCCRTARTGR